MDASKNSRVIVVPAVPTAVAPIAPPETVEECDSRCYNMSYRKSPSARYSRVTLNSLILKVKHRQAEAAGDSVWDAQKQVLLYLGLLGPKTMIMITLESNVHTLKLKYSHLNRTCTKASLVAMPIRPHMKIFVEIFCTNVDVDDSDMLTYT